MEGAGALANGDDHDEHSVSLTGVEQDPSGRYTRVRCQERLLCILEASTQGLNAPYCMCNRFIYINVRR